MSRHRYPFGLESLEPRRLMAVIATIPAEATAEYAPPAPHGTMEPEHMAGSAADVSIAAAKGVPFDMSLSVEPSASWNVLMVQFTKLPEAQLVGLAGGAAEWTDANGAVHFEVPRSTRQFELTIAGERFLRLALDENGRIESYARLDGAGSPTEQPVVSVGNAGNAPITIQVGMGISMLTPTGAALDHHAASAMATTATTASTPVGPGLQSGGNHASMEADSQFTAMTDDMTAAAVGAPHAETGGAASRSNIAMAAVGQNTNDGAADVKRELQVRAAESSVTKGDWASATEEETIDAVFANWAGGEETAHPEPIAALVAEPTRHVLLTNTTQPQPLPPRTLPVASEDRTAIPPVAAVAVELDAEAGGDESDIGIWRASVAIVFSAGCAVGAYALERRAQQPTSDSTRPLRRRPRTQQTPATGSMAKAAM